MRELKKYNGKRVTLMACSSCNASCNDCYIGYTGNRTPEDLYLQAQKLLANDMIVRIDGAEILTNLNYLKTLKLVGQNWIMTNGLRIFREPEIINLLKENSIDTVYMSYHFGIQDKIDSIPASVVDRVIELLKEHNFKIYLNCTLTSHNCDNIIEYADIAYKKGARGIGFNKIFQQGKATDISGLDLSYNQLKKFFEDLAYLRQKYDKNEFYITRGGSLGYDFIRGHDNFVCNAGYNRIMITPDNNVYGCNALCTPKYKIGIYKDGDVYVYDNFYHNQNYCLAEVLGIIGCDNIENLTENAFKELIKEYEMKKEKNYERIKKI